MRLTLVVCCCMSLSASSMAGGVSPLDVAQFGQELLNARLDMRDKGVDDPANPAPNGDNAPTPEYNPSDALATQCFGNDGCVACMQPAIALSNEAYEVLAKNHAWKTWASTEYERMDALASGVSGLNPYAKTAYALTKSRDILPAKKKFEENVKKAQTTTLNSLKSAFEKIGRCEAEFLGKDNFTGIAMIAWQVMRVKYVD